MRAASNHPFSNLISKVASALVMVASAGLILVSGQDAIAIDQETLLLLTDPLTYPLDLQLLEPGAVPDDRSVITAYTISQDGMTVPSLWWANDQFGGKVLENWLAYSGEDGTPRRVDLVVNQQIWSLYTYLERYTFINQFGTVSWDFGYNTRIFNRDQELLAAYICNPVEANAAIAPDSPATDISAAGSTQVSCAVFLNSSGAGSLRGGSSNPFGGGSPSTNGGIVQP